MFRNKRSANPFRLVILAQTAQINTAGNGEDEVHQMPVAIILIAFQE